MMGSKHVDKNVQTYLIDNCLRLSDAQKKLHTETCPADCSQFMNVLVKGTNARRCIEVGTLTGLPTLSMAMALPTDGLVVTLDTIKKNVNPCKDIWKEAGVDQKIQTREGEVIELLENIKTETGTGKWDLISIIDVDKNIKQVFDRCLNLVRPGGMITIHHVLLNGNVLNETKQDENTKAVREFNRMLRDDKRVDVSTIMVGDGLTMCVKCQNGGMMQ